MNTINTLVIPARSSWSEIGPLAALLITPLLFRMRRVSWS